MNATRIKNGQKLNKENTREKQHKKPDKKTPILSREAHVTALSPQLQRNWSPHRHCHEQPTPEARLQPQKKALTTSPWTSAKRDHYTKNETGASHGNVPC